MILYLIRLSTGIVQGTKRVYYSVPERIDGQLWDPQEVLPTQVALFILVQTKEPVNISTTVLEGSPGMQCLNLLLAEASFLLKKTCQSLGLEPWIGNKPG